MAASPGDAVGGACPDEFFPGAKAARELGTSVQQTAGRALARSLSLQSQEQGCLSGVEEAALERCQREPSRSADPQGAVPKAGKKGQAGKGKGQKGETKKEAGPPEGEGHN